MQHIISVTGGSGSGKTTLTNKLHSILKQNGKRVYFISGDWFYRTKPKNVTIYNFDNPNAFDFTLLIKALKEKKTVMLPGYDYVEHKSVPDQHEFDPTQYDVVIIEGIMLYNNEELRALINSKIFVHTDLDVCLARRILRDISERGRTVDSVIKQWFEFVKPGYEDFIFPTMVHADYIFNNTKESIEENIYKDKKFQNIIDVLLN